MAIFSVAYLPSVAYLSAFVKADKQVIDIGEFFEKQTLRTRTEILTANGRLQLFIPVAKAIHPKVSISEMKLSYAENWQRKHEQAIISAYKNAPYFEHYADDFLALLQSKQDSLVQYNLDFLNWILKAFQQEEAQYEISEMYVERGEEADFRTHFPAFAPKVYKQVFAYKFPFEGNLSCIDLLFNKGPEAPIFL